MLKKYVLAKLDSSLRKRKFVNDFELNLNASYTLLLELDTSVTLVDGDEEVHPAIVARKLENPETIKEICEWMVLGD